MHNIINNIRLLCADTVDRAQSGHPGAPMGLAPFAYVLFTDIFQYDPKNPNWVNRDIFILSNGHACALQYVCYHLLGFDITFEDLLNFRQFGSKTPGHPEISTPGVEVTTGPLGQGVANAVGFAIALKMMAQHQSGLDNKVYCVLGDGCFEEGISNEAFSIAGHYALNNLTFIYDYNGITIDGSTDLSVSENVENKFKAMGFEVLVVEDGNNDLEGIKQALLKQTKLPKLIILKTTIGYGSAIEGSEKLHGSPLKKEDLEEMHRKWGIKPFEILEETRNHFDVIRTRNLDNAAHWGNVNETVKKEPINIKFNYKKENKKLATRKHFNNALNDIISEIPNLVGGSADLTPSNLTKWDGSDDFSKYNFYGRYLRYGIREHAMFAIMNGISSYGYHIPYSGTFLVFLLYGFTPVRLAAMSNLHTIYVLTHDSIGLGEDGPTHQPIEVLSLIRATPNLVDIRPADGTETRAALKYALENKKATTLILSRQKVPEIEETTFEGLYKGGYFITKYENNTVTIISNGSELSIAISVSNILKEKNIFASVVSFPSFYLFEQQSNEYKNNILNKNTFIVSIEAQSTLPWYKYVDLAVGVDIFGSSGKYKDIYKNYGLTAESIVDRIIKELNNR
ncbi:Transketolase [Spraguea lophii 42_110]|uniref:Transketolase n=1 Tax=Spraguea lophii (strain 42_110) TaxID=1358809 RepID=S7XK30_SPRLO|nr:Transketolase [Spraguea lophii 42_110]